MTRSIELGLPIHEAKQFSEINTEQETEKSKAEQLWEEKLNVIRAMAARRGGPLERGIEEPVVAINLLGLATTQSCEGHKNRVGLWNPPFVDFTPQAPLDQIPEVEAKAATEAARTNMEQLLAEFYSGQAVAPDEIIQIAQHSSVGTCRLQCCGGAEINLIPEEEKLQRVTRYRNEMSRFANFLKTKIRPQ